MSTQTRLARIPSAAIIVLAAALTAVVVAQERVIVEPVFVDTPKPDIGIERFPVEPGTVFARHDVYAEGAAPGNTAGVSEVLIYDNTLGQIAINTGLLLVSDDIATVAAPGCELQRIEFAVTGKVDPAGTGGPYTVDFAFYSNCPGAVPGTNPVIPGTQGRVVFPDDAPRLVNFILPGAIAIQPNVWFGVKFNRSNAGVLAGAPALSGASCDSFDFPGFPCSGALGGFPDHPHASFNLRLYGNADTCTSAFVGYKNIRPSAGVFNPGMEETLVDDIHLGVPSCQMIGYEVAVRGTGSFEFDMRRNCEGSIIVGSEKTYDGLVNTVQTARFMVDPPVALPENFFFATRVNNPLAGIVTTGTQACVGSTEDVYLVAGETGCFETSPPDPVLHDGVNLTILCAGEPPIGACCDMYFRDEGNEAVCRQLPKMNCPFPPRQSPEFRPQWVSGAQCEPNPFGNLMCGQAACCYKEGKFPETCDNLTLNECNAIEPLDRPRQWQIGRSCGNAGQHCPIGCGGLCTEALGCDNQECCECCRIICAYDLYCCQVEFDGLCYEYAWILCDDPCFNDCCAATEEFHGARLITLANCFATTQTAAFGATTDPTDPGFGCYIDNPGAQGIQTVWYKFIAGCNDTLVSTCASNPPADDSLVAVYAVGDMTNEETQCATLIPVACNDDSPGCGSSRKNSRLCVPTIPGNLYYIQVAAKEAETQPGVGYRVTISSAAECPASNDFCPFAFDIADGVTAFDFTPAAPTPAPTLDGPFDECIPTTTADMWYDYRASCTGTVTVATCGAPNPDTNLSIYDSLLGQCVCPMAYTPSLACSADDPTCGPASRLQTHVVAGKCYRIRLGDSAESRPEGNLSITCHPDCPAGTGQAVVPSGDVVDARRAHPLGNFGQAEGIQTVTIDLPPDALPTCFSLCETAIEGGPNSIVAVVEDPPGRYTIDFVRPITANAKTTITYRDVDGQEWHLRLASHPGNVNADGFVSLADVTALIRALEGASALPYGHYSGDIDRSGVISAADLLAWADVLLEPCYDCPTYPNPLDDPRCP